MNELWSQIEYDIRYQVSNHGRFRKQNPIRKNNLFLVKIKDKNFNCARLVANAFIKKLEKNERVYHKNKLKNDNYYRNLKVVSLQELGKLTGHISNSKRVVEVKNGEIARGWRSARKCGLDLFISYQTVNDYCNCKVECPMFNLMWEDDYFEEEFGNSIKQREWYQKEYKGLGSMK